MFSYSLCLLTLLLTTLSSSLPLSLPPSLPACPSLPFLLLPVSSWILYQGLASFPGMGSHLLSHQPLREADVTLALRMENLDVEAFPLHPAHLH